MTADYCIEKFGSVEFLESVVITHCVCLNQGFPTFSRSRTAWASCIVNVYYFQNN